MNLIRCTRTVHVNERRDIVRLVHEETLIVREFALTIRNIKERKYPKGWKLALEEQWTEDYFTHTAKQGRAREAHSHVRR